MSEPVTESETSVSETSPSTDASGAAKPAAETTVESPATTPSSEQTENASVSFEQAAYEEQPGLIAEFLEFLVESKAWWLTPIIVVLLLVGLLIVLSGSVIAPFIYPIF